MDKELEENLQKIKNGLAALEKVFNQPKINYRVLGSVLVAALNQKPHRPLGDFDVLFGQRDSEKVIVGLEAEGFVAINKQKLGFHWTEWRKDDSLGFTFLLVGSFKKDYFSCQLSKNIELRISQAYLRPTEYSLLGVKLIGIPVRSLYEGLKVSNLNPKRQLDRLAVEKIMNNQIPTGDSLEKAFKIYLFGREIPYAYPIFSQIYNLYGGLRVFLGKKYEIWD